MMNKMCSWIRCWDQTASVDTKIFDLCRTNEGSKLSFTRWEALGKGKDLSGIRKAFTCTN